MLRFPTSSIPCEPVCFRPFNGSHSSFSTSLAPLDQPALLEHPEPPASGLQVCSVPFELSAPLSFTVQRFSSGLLLCLKFSNSFRAVCLFVHKCLNPISSALSQMLSFLSEDLLLLLLPPQSRVLLERSASNGVLLSPKSLVSFSRIAPLV